DFTGSTDLSPYLDFAYQNGARIHNNSWGDDDVDQGVYSLHAQQLDKFIFEHPGYTAVFAAGNEGKDGASQKELLDTMSKLGIDPTKPLNPNDLIGGMAGYGDLIDQLTSGDPFGNGGTGGLGDGTSLGGLFGGSIGAYLQLMTDIQDMQARSTGVVELGSLSAPSTAKNVITVGASEGDRPNGQGYGGVAEGTWMQVLQVFGADPIASDYTSNNVNGMAPFSSRGPTTDGRIKPDISAPGTNIISVRSTLAEAPANNPLAGDAGNPVYWGAAPNASYAYAGGTSVSAPMVSGAAALVREYYQKKGIAEPSAALIKATLINTAVDMVPGQYGTGAKQEMTARPNFVEGWGRLNLSSLSPVAAQKLAFQEAGAGLATGDSAKLTYHVAEAGKPLHFTLVWSDAPGSPTAAKALVNDLDLSVKAPDGSNLLGNGAEDHANNVEGVDIASAAAGDYVLTVKATNVPEGPQPYAVVASGALTTGTSVGGVPGDLNGDGKVTVADAVLALKIAVGSAAAPTGDALTLADVAPKPGTGGRAVGDGKVDVQDAIRILKHILGMDAGQWP
ncbi:MAG TPA: S8 family serine peptidase, partial [Armatimonadota bacterium]